MTPTKESRYECFQAQRQLKRLILVPVIEVKPPQVRGLCYSSSVPLALQGGSVSADNVVIVEKRPVWMGKNCWHVWHQSASCAVDPSAAMGKVLRFRRKRDAVMAAHKMAAKIGYVEYGVTVL